MAFFGLTKLGPQNLFVASSKEALNLTIFTDGDMEAAFDQTCGQSASAIRKVSLRKYFQKLYCGPLIPESDVQSLEQLFGADDNDSVERTSFLAALKVRRESTQEWLQGTKSKTAEFVSNKKFREATRKNNSLKYSPADKFNHTITSAHEIGWLKPTDSFSKTQKRFPKVSSEETKFADVIDRLEL